MQHHSIRASTIIVVLQNVSLAFQITSTFSHHIAPSDHQNKQKNITTSSKRAKHRSRGQILYLDNEAGMEAATRQNRLFYYYYFQQTPSAAETMKSLSVSQFFQSL